MFLQYEEPDDWLCFGNPWERVRQGISYPVKYRGKVEIQGGRRVWTDTEMVYAVPYDMPIPGYRCNICCTLRLWGCKAPKSFDLPAYNTGSFIEVRSKTINLIHHLGYFKEEYVRKYHDNALSL